MKWSINYITNRRKILLLVATCDNTEDLKFGPRQKKEKSDIPKTNKNNLSKTKSNSILVY